ncbi:MAG: pilus assembly protein PilM [Opitutaceae bacterium]
MRAPRVLAVDIGAGHVACGVFAVGASGRLVLQQFALEPHSSDPAHEGRWSVEIAQSLGAISSRRKLSGPAAIAVPGHLALTKFIKTPSVAKEKRGKIIGFEAAENIPYPLEEVVWDHVVVSDDGFDLEVMLAASKFDAMQALCSAADAAGFPVERATPATLALCHAFRYSHPNIHDSVIVVNVGARTTTLLFLEGDRFYARTLPLAGNSVTQTVAEELRIDFGSAETLKIQVLSGKSDLPAGSPSRGAVQRAAAGFITKLQLEITRSSVNHRRQSGSAAPVTVYLTGGGSLIDELPAGLAERLRLPVERYQTLKNVDLSADARAAGAEGAAPVLADLVGLATHLIKKDEADASLLPPALTAALAFRKRQPIFMAAAALVVIALMPPIVYLHRVTIATLERVSQVDGQLMPLRAVEQRNAENLRQIEEATKQITALRGAYETKANWINFLADLQERLVKIEDVWLDKLQVVRPPLPEPGGEQVVEGGQAAPDAGQPAAAEAGQVASDGGRQATSETTAAADPNTTPEAPPTVPVRPPVRLTLSGRLLDVANPQSKVSSESLQRVKQLLASFTGSQFIAAVENERFDTNQNGLLKFDFTLVINPRKTL